MKKFILVLVFTLSCNANSDIAKDKQCETYGELAASIMSARQANVKLSQIMSISQSSETARQIVILAYKEPLWASNELKQSTIAEFENKIVLACYNSK